MNKTTGLSANIDDTSTWTKYKAGLCQDCRAYCCRLPVEAKIDDLIRMEVVDPFEAGNRLKKVAKQLQKDGIIDHFNLRSGKFTLARRPNNDCIYLDSQTRRCTIYDKRPNICRNHPEIGPKPGFCAYQKK